MILRKLLAPSLCMCGDKVLLFHQPITSQGRWELSAYQGGILRSWVVSTGIAFLYGLSFSLLNCLLPHHVPALEADCFPQDSDAALNWFSKSQTQPFLALTDLVGPKLPWEADSHRWHRDVQTSRSRQLAPHQELSIAVSTFSRKQLSMKHEVSILALPLFTRDELFPRHGESSGSLRHSGDTAVLGVPPDSCADGLCCGRLVEWWSGSLLGEVLVLGSIGSCLNTTNYFVCAQF